MKVTKHIGLNMANKQHEILKQWLTQHTWLLMARGKILTLCLYLSFFLLLAVSPWQMQ